MNQFSFSIKATLWAPRLTFVVFAIIALAALAASGSATAKVGPTYCGTQGVWIQTLGSGGPDLAQGRAGASYLIWEDQRARVLVNAGAGSAVNFAESGAHLKDLEAVLLTNLHPDTWTDLPTLLRRAYYGQRKTDLPVLAPAGDSDGDDGGGDDGDDGGGAGADNLRRLLAPWYQLDTQFIYPAELLASMSSPPVVHADFRLRLQSVPSAGTNLKIGLFNQQVSVHSVPVDFGKIPAVAWRIGLGGLNIVVIGNAAGPADQIVAAAQDADVLVMHLNIEESRRGSLRQVAMTPSRIGQLAARAQVRLLLLGHRMGRTIGLETVNRPLIKKHFRRSLKFVDDNDCYGLKPRKTQP